jgi:hypothetical protein
MRIMCQASSSMMQEASYANADGEGMMHKLHQA